MELLDLDDVFSGLLVGFKRAHDRASTIFANAASHSLRSQRLALAPIFTGLG
jgi:hypothetical protein